MNSSLDTFELEAQHYQMQRKTFWSDLLERRTKSWSGYYRRQLENTYKHLVAENSTILELGCGQGDLLAALKPSHGVGVDFCEIAVELGKKHYPHLHYVVGDAHTLNLPSQHFDYIVISELVNDLWDVQTVLEQLRPYCGSQTRVITNFYSHLWNIPLSIARRLGIARPSLPQNWLTVHDMCNLLEVSGFETIRDAQEIILPVPIPIISKIANRYLAKLFPFRFFAMANFLIARPNHIHDERNPSASVIVAARNESGHIDELIDRIPEMGIATEIVFVEGNSTDDTYEAIRKAINERPHLNCKLLKQSGKGKGDAVRAGFEVATGDILMILDADITVPPEELPRFFNLVASGDAEFANGVRLVYPMQDDAMRFANLFANKFFSWAFSWLLGQQIRDTLCGTKVLWQSDYQRIAAERHYFGDFDPFGDFDLLFGAAKLNLKIMDIPVRYRSRRYGNTNISRWSHGWLLLKMVVFAAKRLKFA